MGQKKQLNFQSLKEFEGKEMAGMTDSEMLRAMYGEIVGMKQQMQEMDDRIQGLDDQIQGMNKLVQKIPRMDEQIREIQMTLENETNRNIQLIAEGHRDLTRKLDDALKIENEKEILMIRVNTLESEVEKLKSRTIRVLS